MEVFLNWIKADQFMCDAVQSQCIVLLTDMKQPSYSGFLRHFTDCFALLQAAQCLMLYQLGVL